MRRAMQSEDAGHLNGGVAGGRDGSLIAFGRERNFGKVRHIQHVGVHLLIPALIAAVTAACGDHHETRYALRVAIKVDRAALHMEASIHVVRISLSLIHISPVETLERAKAIADAEGLHFVYIGNVPGHPAQNTYCPKCRKMLVERVGFTASEMLIKNGKCPFCQQPIPGVWHV